MNLAEQVFQYCERGTDPALWAEPLNAISNAGFFLAALIFWQCLLWRPPEQRNADHYLLIALTFLIGAGSLAFHLFANVGTELADVIPIVLFMLVYLGVALNRFLSVPPGWTVLLVVGFTGIMVAASRVHCWDGGMGLAGTVEDSKVCLNGSMYYLPALAAMMIVGMLAAERRHKAAPYVLWAAVVFIVSVILRTLDFSLCDVVVIDGRDVGTHFMWHLLNAVVLFLLMRATLETGYKEAPADKSEPTTPVPPPVEAVPATEALRESPEVASAGEAAAIEAAKPDPEPEPEPEEPKAEEPEPEPEEPKPEEPEPKDVDVADVDDRTDDAEAAKVDQAGADEPEFDGPPKKRRPRRKKPSFPA